MDVLYLILSLAGLVLGSGFAVSSAQSMAKRLGVSEMVIGLTIAALGTSLPEIMTNIISGMNTSHGVDASGIAIGNIIGSDMAKITLILGLSGFVSVYLVNRMYLMRDGICAIAALLSMYLVASDGHVSPTEGKVLVALYLLYLVNLLRQESLFDKKHKKSGKTLVLAGVDLFKSLIGLVIVVYCADYVVNQSLLLAKNIGLGKSMIGVILGIGTALPELAVSVRAMMNKASDLSLGNLVGSCIADPTFSFGVGAAIGGVNVSKSILAFDFPFWMASTIIALILLRERLDLTRRESAILVIVYALFMCLRLTFFAG
jgi:cation:H+ antiporter